MNYLNGNITYNEFTFDHYQVLYNDGTIIDGGASSGLSSPKEIIYNLATRNEKGMPLMVYAPVSTTAGYMFFNVNVDYIYFSVASYQCQFKLKKMDDETLALNTSSNYTDSATYCSQYYDNDGESVNYDYTFNRLEYAQYNTHFNIYNNSSVFDLSRMQYNFGDLTGDLTPHVFNALESRPDNSLYYKYCLYVSGYNLSTNSMTIHNSSDTRGSAIYRSWQTAYENGQANGYVNGYADGWNDRGQGNEVGDAFDVLGGAFNSVSSIMSLEVLPHVTLGLCFSIPFVLIMIMTIIKLVKK